MMSSQECSAIFAYLNVITTMSGKPEQQEPKAGFSRLSRLSGLALGAPNASESCQILLIL